jgi:peptidoglycan/LPS O-acetylase OafA/YrhL
LGSASQTSAWKHEPALDGIRALAIAQVLALHGARSFLPGGFFGVDLFFVLSGFLITRVLLQDHAEHGKIRLARFWGRRARRILPAVGVCLGLAFLLWSGMPDPKPTFWQAAVPTAFYFANIQAMIDPSKLGAMIHAWSLSTEEQFYAVWPLVLAPLLLVRRSRAIMLLVAVLAAAAVARLVLRDQGSPLGTYYSPLARMDELLIGCLLALFPEAARLRARPFYRVGAWLFLGALPLLWYYMFTELWVLYAGGFTLFALGAAMLVSVAVDPSPSPLKRALSVRLFAAIGRRSYGLYLFHLPIFMWFERFREADHALNFVWVSALRIACTFAVAELSYRLVERPILEYRRKRREAPAPASSPASVLPLPSRPTLNPPGSNAAA